MRRELDDPAQTTIRRELAWALALAIGGAASFVLLRESAWSLDRSFASALPIGVPLAALVAVAAFRAPRLGWTFPFALGAGAALVYLLAYDDPYWPLGLQVLALALLPFFAVAIVAQMLGRARRRRQARR